MQRPRQLSLGLRECGGWGGRRTGAGRKPGRDPKVVHRSRGPIRGAYPCHVTMRKLPDVPSLRTRKLVREFMRSLRASCDRSKFRVVHFSLQHTHVHLIVEAETQTALGRGMMSIGSRLARAVNRCFSRHGRVLSDRYHVRPLATPREVRRAIAYVLLNLRKHLAERCPPRSRIPVGPDPASSGRWFDGWRAPPNLSGCLGPQNPGESDRSVARPRSWLLRVGWRRHGLLRPDEIPGMRS